jgi:hypothetical protein
VGTYVGRSGESYCNLQSFGEAVVERLNRRLVTGGDSELKNVCVWNKHNAGMGTFYRS